MADRLFAGRGATPGSAAALPEPWRSMLPRRGQGGGPQGQVVVGATTPPFDGITVAILAVHSADESFTADVEVVPGLMHWHQSGEAVDTPLLAWWAADDRGHHYLGQQARWHFSPDRAGGQIESGPARPGRPDPGHQAGHDGRAGRHPGAAGMGRGRMSVPWWRGIPPAVARVSCDGREHQLRWAAGELLAPGHPDLEGEQILGALAGQRGACLEALDAWAGHADDLRVLVMASRGAADPVRVRPQDAAYVAPSVMGRGQAVMARRRAAVTAMMIGGGLRERGDTLATLLSLGGPMQARLTATVAAAWRERLRDGAAPADAAAAQAARPALHAALYGRVVATLRGWTGQPALKVTLTMIGEAAPPALARDGDGVAAELPFGWISDVWARGLGTCWDRFCLAAGRRGRVGGLGGWPRAGGT